jgi:CDP-glucose 4,6-dehydratase
LLHEGQLEGDAWNFGPATEASMSVGDVVALLQRSWPRLRIQHDDGEHPHEAPLLALDSNRAERELGWRPVWDAATAVARTARWYQAQADSGTLLTHDDLVAYASNARRAGLEWA